MHGRKKQRGPDHTERNKKIGSLKEATVVTLPQDVQNFTLKIRRMCEEVVNRKPSEIGEAKLY
jgi:hypothetical protein